MGLVVINARADFADRGVDDLVAEWVHHQPTACAVRETATGTSISYAELWERSATLADDLSGRGVRYGDLVAVAMDPSIDLIVGFLGIIRAGAAYLPLDNRAPGQRLSLILDEAGTDLVVCPEDGAARAWRDRLPAGARLIHPPTVSPPAAPEPSAAGPAAGDDPVYVAFTSGSTGRPKGVVVPHRAVLRLVVEPNYCTIAPGDRVANLSNPAFDATTFEVWSTLTAGGTVVVFPSATDLAIDDWVACLERERITTMFLTTSLFHTMARECPGAFRTLDNLVVGGEQLDIEMVRRVHAAGPPRRLVNGYGPTETTTFAAAFECTPDSLAGLERVPIGFPLQNTTLDVVGEALTPVAPGETGELCIGGPGVAIGYLNRPDLTGERFVDHPVTGKRVYRTGDLARRLPGGALEVVGRRDRQVKLRGFRIELEEIEKAVLDTGLADSVFVEKVGDGPGAGLVAFVLPSITVTDADPDGLPAVLESQLTERLSDYMIPSRWLVLDRVPLGPTGKADRARLLAMLDQPAAAPVPAENGSGMVDTVEPLRQIWQHVLGVPVTAGDNFIELGGNSILAVQAASRISQRFAERAEPADILIAGSLGELAQQLRRPV